MVSRASLTSWVEGASLATKRLLHREVKILPSFSAMFARGSSSLQLFPVVWILLRSLGVICYDRWVLSEGQGSLSHELTACLFFNLFKLNELWPCSKACRPDSFEWRNFLKLSFSNIWGLRSNFVDCESFIESNSLESNSCSPWDKPGWPWFWQFLCERLSSFNPKDSSTHMHGLTVYVKEGLPFARDFSLENSADSYLYFKLAVLHSVSYFFFLYWSPSLSLCTVFDSISSNIDELLSINPSAYVFLFREFNFHHKD